MSSYDSVRPPQHVRRNREADLLGSFQIDDELELRRSLDRQIGWLSAFEDFVDEISDALVVFSLVVSVGHQAAAGDKMSKTGYCRQPMF